MTDGRPDGQMNGWKARSGKMEDTGMKAKSGREDKNGLPEHECCPRETSYKHL